MQYGSLKKLIVPHSDSDNVILPKELFRRLLTGALKNAKIFDEDFYVAANFDIGAAIRSNKITSGAEHYFLAGYFEDRLPRQLIVDEEFYLENNPDVFAAIKKMRIRSAQEHFEFSGFKEGRVPFKGFSMI